MFQTKFQIIRSAVISHLNAFFNDPDQVKYERSRHYFQHDHDQSTLDRQFIFPLVIVLCITVQTLIGLEGYDSWSDIEIRADRVVTHKVFPEEIALQTDLIVGTGTANLLVMLLYRLMIAKLESKYFMYLNLDNGSLVGSRGKLSRKVSTQIYRLRRTIRRCIYWALITWLIALEVYFTQQLIIKRNFQIDRKSVV